MRYLILILSAFILNISTFAQDEIGPVEDCPKEVVPEKLMSEKIDDAFGPVVTALGTVLFWDPFDAVGIYDPVVYNDQDQPVRADTIKGTVYGEAGSATVNGHCTDFTGMEGTRIILNDVVYTVESVQGPEEMTVDKAVEQDYYEAYISNTTEKPIPIIVLWLVFGAIFFTVRSGFINIKGFKHAIDLVRGKFDSPEAKEEKKDAGEVSHFQALVTALSATVGLGNIAGVAIAVSVGGAGATFWLIIAGLLGMSTKFIECTLGVKYRKVNENGEVSGGPMYYLSKGLEKRNKKVFGKILAGMFALLCVGGSFGGGNMFQSNQAFEQMKTKFQGLADTTVMGLDAGVIFGIIMAIFVAVVIVGGIKSIANVTDKIVPFMVGMYVLAALVIIGMNIGGIGDAFAQIFNGAFNPDAVKGGILGVLIVGFQRAAFSNEAGVGSASIAHSAVKTDKPVTEGFVSLLEPFIDTVVVCTMTALVLIFTGYVDNPSNLAGSSLTSSAFTSVIPWFDWVLLLAIVLFAFSTMISWSYYGLKAWTYLFGEGKIQNYLYKGLFLIFIVVGSSSSLNNVIGFSDLMILGMAFPNILGLYFLSGEVVKDMKAYLAKVKSGEIKKYK